MTPPAGGTGKAIGLEVLSALPIVRPALRADVRRGGVLPPSAAYPC